MPIGVSFAREHELGLGRAEQCFAQELRVSLTDLKSRSEHSGFVPPPRMPRIENVVAELDKVDDCAISIR